MGLGLKVDPFVELTVETESCCLCFFSCVNQTVSNVFSKCLQMFCSAYIRNKSVAITDTVRRKFIALRPLLVSRHPLLIFCVYTAVHVCTYDISPYVL